MAMNKAWLREGMGLLLFLAGMVLFRSAVADWMEVPTGSMNPTVLEGDRVLVDKRAYGWRIPFTTTRLVEVGEPQRGDVVVLDSPESTLTLLKRVVAVPGDRVELVDDHLILNGVPVRYAALPKENERSLLDSVRALHPEFFEERLPGHAHAVMVLPGQFSERNMPPLVVPAGAYLVMGDNRDNSHDSRDFGLVKRKAIFGRAVRVLVSLDPDHNYLPRRERLFGPAL